MQGVHPLADLAPRDVVAKAITRRMLETGRPHMWLDAHHLGGAASEASLGDVAAREARAASFWEKRFPTILATCRRHGVDPVTELIPVAPACHYASGGVATDLWGRSTLPGLYATGEVACSGVHGANRLASNSLLEGLVFSRRIAEVLPAELRAWSDPAADHRPPGLVDGAVRRVMQEEMTSRAGVLRSAEGLTAGIARLEELAGTAVSAVDQDAWEATNLVTISTLLARAALLREETRGSHWREDFPERDDEPQSGHYDWWVADGQPAGAFRPAAPTDAVPDEVPA
jgi:L-aspartate oxidase